MVSVSGSGGYATPSSVSAFCVMQQIKLEQRYDVKKGPTLKYALEPKIL